MPRWYQKSATVNSKFAADNWLQISCIKTLFLINSSFASSIFICFLLAFLAFHVCKFNNNNNNNNSDNNSNKNNNDNNNNNNNSNNNNKIIIIIKTVVHVRSENGTAKVCSISLKL